MKKPVDYWKIRKVRGAYLTESCGKEMLMVPCLDRAFSFYITGRDDRYVYVWTKDSPLAKSGAVALHRIVPHETMGRPIYSRCVMCRYPLPWVRNEENPDGGKVAAVVNVDHINEITLDCRPSNLRPLCKWCNLYREFERWDPEVFSECLSGLEHIHPGERPGMPKLLRLKGIQHPLGYRR